MLEATNPLLTFLKPSFQGKRVLVGVSGSIAAYKSVEIIRHLQKMGAEVRAVMTEGAAKFLSPLTLEAITRQEVSVSMWEGSSPGTHHISSARWADLFLIAPASAHTIAKVALGIAGDLLSTECLAFTGPIAIAPAMNPAMYAHPAVVENLKIFEKRGVSILGPGIGDTACGEEGEGRMMEPDFLLREWATKLAPVIQKWACVSLGGTKARIDPVRFITNRSSGRMGASIAWALRRRGFGIQAVIAGNVSEKWMPSDSNITRVQSTNELADQVKKTHKDSALFASVSAALDWEVEESSEKLKKEKGLPALRFREARDSLKEWGELLPLKPALGFAAESSTDQATRVKTAREKMERKKTTAIFVNPVSATGGFDSEVNEGVYVAKQREVPFQSQSKVDLAAGLVDEFLKDIGI